MRAFTVSEVPAFLFSAAHKHKGEGKLEGFF